MKKALALLFCAFFAVIGAVAQRPTNSAYGLKPTILSAANTPTDAQLAYLTDGDMGLSYAEGVNSAAFGSTNPTIFYYDLGEEKTLGRIAISWTGAHANTYKIYAVNTAPADANAAAALTGAIVDVTGVSVPPGQNKVVTHDVTASGRYIVFVATAFDYGCTMHEFAVYNEAYTQVFTSIMPTSGIYIYNAAQNVPLIITDQEGVTYNGVVSSISFVNATYGYATNPSGSDFTFGADFPRAIDDLSVTAGGITITKGFGFLNTTPSIDDVPAIVDDESYVIFSAEKNEAHEVMNTYDGDNTSVIENFIIGDKTARRIKTMKYVGFRNTTLSSATDMTGLVLDIFVTENHAKENCHVKAENVGIVNFPADLSKGWNHVVIPTFNTTNLSGLNSNVTLFIRIDDAETENVVIYNVYYTKAASFIDTENPVMSSVTVASTTHNSATLTVKATDDNTSGTLTYTVMNSNSEVGTGSGVQNVDATVTITGLTPETSYSAGDFTVIATDPSGKSSTAMNVPAFTTSAAPAGLELTAGGHTILIQGKHYLDRSENNWELIVYSDDEMASLGPCYWTLNSGNFNMQDNYIKSSDNKTLTISATSTTKPVLYNNFYVNFSVGGEANFGEVNNNGITWQEIGEASNEVVVTVSGNTALVTGAVSASDVATIINDAGSAAIIDLTGATLSESVTITPTNKNAIIVVDGTKRSSDKIANLGSTKNIVVFDDTYRRAATGYVIELVDENASQPAYDFVIDALDDGVTYTRTIAANARVSVNSPAPITIPSTLTIYKATAATTNSITFTKQEVGGIGANEPVVLHNTTNESIVLTSSVMKGDLNLTANPGGTAIGESVVTQFGTVRAVAADGTQFALQGGNLKQFNTGAKIGAFRVYYTGLTVGSNAIAIFDEGNGTTSIQTINANGEIDNVFYDLSGRRVENPTKGIYIMNGKKVVIK